VAREAILPAELRSVERRVRILQIFKACSEVGMAPLAGDVLHVLAYLTDALAPVWHLPMINAQILKRDRRPFFPSLQEDIDWLVGAGVVMVDSLEYLQESNGHSWRLSASYTMTDAAATKTLDLASQLSGQRRNARFVREVCLAASGLGDDELLTIGDLDAAYSDALTDVGNLLDLETQRGRGLDERLNRSAAVAARFRVLAGADDFSESEMVHMYIRHLYSRVHVA
jgi:hypothetical protein